ncbi:cation diffusion facilitator family transporter [Microlunatus soli]|uniref:Cation diffusion facilitator family transporter n=1 Tax=Microlunatus soli TaxID=630515 RepID=A0A1H1NTL8_9ACTN|nr:cation diffusion facilitator family transporter [Microlunatus soli]SDS02318.1 cation diffusion facilitator family transporter [Microlunatus soli]
MESTDEVLSDAPAEQESLRTVLIAFGANLLVAIAKTVAAVLTSSASMVAEAAHSWADAGNEIFLLFADRKGSRERDAAHPMGYGRDSYVWSMFAAFGLFTVGAVVSIMHGIQELSGDEPGGNYLINYIVLAVAFVLEGTSFLQAFRQARSSARRLGSQETLSFVLRTSNPTLRAVFAEDAAALIGLLIAAAGIAAHQITGSPIFDAIGSILVGVLLAVVALVLINRNRRFLVGQAVSPALRRTILTELLTHPDVDRITYLHVEFVGPSRVYLVAAIDLAGNRREDDLAVHLRRIERELETRDAVEEAVLTLSTQDEESLTA